MLYFMKDKKGYTKCDENNADYALVPIEEYNGLRNALRIVRDRALQQVDKSKTDEHGYKLLKADFRQFRRLEAYSWYITKQTPYSAKIPLTEVEFLIKRDLEDFYGLVNATYEYSEGHEMAFDAEDYCKGGREYRAFPNREYVLENSPKGRKLKEVFDAHDGRIVFLLDRLTINHAVGLYEIGYWATGTI